MSNAEVKKILIEDCKFKLKEKIEFIGKAMEEAQEVANLHKGAMASRYDTFKQEAQALKDGYAKQLPIILQALQLMSEISLNASDTVQFGSIVETNEKRYFISTGLLDKAIIIGEQEYLFISPASPIGQLLLRKKIGDRIEFKGRKIEIKNIF